jgi:hypothetical protein
VRVSARARSGWPAPALPGGLARRCAPRPLRSATQCGGCDAAGSRP